MEKKRDYNFTIYNFSLKHKYKYIHLLKFLDYDKSLV